MIDLEPLWLGRVADILAGEPELRYADLTNQKTHQANHNAVEIEALLGLFRSHRGILLRKLKNLREDDLLKTALQPRMKTPLRMIDLAYFVAEHDDHHLAQITWLDESMEGLVKM